MMTIHSAEIVVERDAVGMWREAAGGQCGEHRSERIIHADAGQGSRRNCRADRPM